MHMKKSILFSLVLALTMGMPAMAEEPAEMTSETAMQQTEPVITANGQHIRIQNAMGKQVHIYDITGVEVYCENVDSMDKTFTLNLGKGCYIVKVGRTARKITIQ